MTVPINVQSATEAHSIRFHQYHLEDMGRVRNLGVCPSGPGPRVSVLDAPLVVVLGHDSCGAVAAACGVLEDGQTPAGYVRDVDERVTPSVLAARAAGRTSGEEGGIPGRPQDGEA